MPRLSRTKLLRKQYRWSGSTAVDRQKTTPKQAEALRQAEARRAARGFV
jgi:hypothetical protein